MSNQDLGPRNIVQAIEGMSLTYNPEVDQNLAAIIQFKISGEGGGDYYLNIADGNCDFSTGLAPKPTLTIESPADVWLKIARKELSGAIALMSGKYKASGQMGLLLKMDKLFTRKPTEAELIEKGWLEPAGE